MGTEDVTHNQELAAGLARATNRLAKLTEAGVAVRKITVINAEPAFMLGFEDDTPAPRRRR